MFVIIGILAAWIHLTQTNEGTKILDYVLHQDFIFQISKGDFDR